MPFLNQRNSLLRMNAILTKSIRNHIISLVWKSVNWSLMHRMEVNSRMVRMCDNPHDLDQLDKINQEMGW